VGWKRIFGGSLLAGIGFMLSPLSWWNDLVVNLPLALAFAWLVSFVHKSLFEGALIVGYWLTNVLGFILMHKGARKILSAKDRKYSWQSLLKDLGISLAYTGLIVLLLKIGVLKPFTSYFQGGPGGND
jgi:hypothetical protein